MKIYEAIRLRITYGGNTTLDELVDKVQGNKKPSVQNATGVETWHRE